MPLNEWKKYPTNKMVNPYATKFYQKRFPDIEDREVFVSVWEYDSTPLFEKTMYEAELYLDNYLPQGRAVIIKLFIYYKLDFELIESEANLLLERLFPNK